MTIQVSSLFETELVQVPPLKKFMAGLPTLLKTIESLKAEGCSDSAVSVRNGWRLNNPHAHPRLQILDGYLKFLLRHVAKIYSLPTDGKYSFASWLNVHDKPGGYNTLHHHGGNLISGVLYLSVPEGSGAISFRDPRASINYLHRPPSSDFNDRYKSNKLFPEPNIAVHPKPGLTILFPSWLEHEVAAFQPLDCSDELPINQCRVSLAFNFTPIWKD